MLIAHSHIVVQTDDHVILFLVDRGMIKSVENSSPWASGFLLAMHFSVTFRILGLLLMLFSTTMLTPLFSRCSRTTAQRHRIFAAMGITFFRPVDVAAGAQGQPRAAHP